MTDPSASSDGGGRGDPKESGFRADPDPHGTTDDLAVLARLAKDLVDGVVRALGPWVERRVRERADQWRPGSAVDSVDAAAAAGRAAASDVGARVRALLESDVDQQSTGPLALLREAVAYPTAVLTQAGVPPVVRDEFAERVFPADVYDLAPASFADLDPALHEPGLVWGAAKAHVVLARRRAEAGVADRGERRLP